MNDETQEPGEGGGQQGGTEIHTGGGDATVETGGEGGQEGGGESGGGEGGAEE